MKNSILSIARKNKAMIIATLCVILSLFTVFDNIIDFAGRGYIHDQAVEFLNNSEIAASESFLVLSTAKAGLALLESSEGGFTLIIDAQVQLGKVFNVLSRLIDRAWEISFLSLSTIFASKILIDTAQKLVEPLLILLSTAGLVHVICKRFAINLTNITGNIFSSAAIGTFVLVFALPISIFATSIISREITREYSVKAQKSYIEHNKLFEHESTDEDLKESSHVVIKKYSSNKKDINSHIEKLHKHVYQHAAIAALEVFFLPLLILGTLYFAANRIMKRQTSISVAREDLSSLLAREDAAINKLI